MTLQELLDLRARFWFAKHHGYAVGSPSGYVAELEAIAGPVAVDAKKGSVDHLLELVEKAIKVMSSPKVASKPAAPKAAAPAPKPTPAPAKVAAPKAEPKAGEVEEAKPEPKAD